MLPPQLTTESIKQPHISYPYNPIIADVLFKTTFLENWGSGAGRIMDACKAQNVEIPTWIAQCGFIIVSFKRETEEVTSHTSDKHPSGTPQVPPKEDSSTTQVAFVINAMSDGKYILGIDLMNLCEMKSRKRFRENYITPAIEDGAIERKYPDQPNHPKQQYRLTEKVLEWKRNQE
ncbi:MAG: Fic family protein [Bacteroidales bacterium]